MKVRELIELLQKLDPEAEVNLYRIENGMDDRFDIEVHSFDDLVLIGEV